MDIDLNSITSNNTPSVTSSDSSSISTDDNSSVSFDDSFFQNLDNDLAESNATFEEQVQQIQRRENQEAPSLALGYINSNNHAIRETATNTLAQEILASSSSRNRPAVKPSKVPNFTDFATKNTGGRSM